MDALCEGVRFLCLFQPGHGEHAHLAAHVEQQLDEAFAVGDEGARVDHLQHFLARGPADVHDFIGLQAQVPQIDVALDEVEIIKAARKVDEMCIRDRVCSLIFSPREAMETCSQPS